MSEPKRRADDLEPALAASTRLAEGPVQVCRAPGTLAAVKANGQKRVEAFVGASSPAGHDCTSTLWIRSTAASSHVVVGVHPT